MDHVFTVQSLLGVPPVRGLAIGSQVMQICICRTAVGIVLSCAAHNLQIDTQNLKWDAHRHIIMHITLC